MNQGKQGNEIEEVINDEYLKKLQEEVDNIEPDIPSDASPTLIKELLGRLSSEIDYWSGKAVMVRSRLNDQKVKIDTKKEMAEREKSKVRQQQKQMHKEEEKEFLEMANKMFLDVINAKNKVAKSTLQELLRSMKPDKPTKSDLDDIANIETEYLYREIDKLIEEKNRLEMYHDLLQAKVKKYENKLKAVISYKGILVAEMNNLDK